MRLFVTSVALAVIVLSAACGGGDGDDGGTDPTSIPPTASELILRGTVTFAHDEFGFYLSDGSGRVENYGDYCDQFENVTRLGKPTRFDGLQVVVTDEANTVIATWRPSTPGIAPPSGPVGLTCVYKFDIRELPSAEFYTVKASVDTGQESLSSAEEVISVSDVEAGRLVEIPLRHR